jgi:hypothetical protein
MLLAQRSATHGEPVRLTPRAPDEMGLRRRAYGEPDAGALHRIAQGDRMKSAGRLRCDNGARGTPYVASRQRIEAGGADHGMGREPYLHVES